MKSRNLDEIIEDIKKHEKKYPNSIGLANTDYHLYLTRGITTSLPYGEDGDMKLMNIFSGALEDGFDTAIIYNKNLQIAREFEIKTSYNFDPSITINTTIADLFENKE